MSGDSTVSLSTVFLFDVDNTLLDNDRVIRDLRQQLIGQVGRDAAEKYWQHFESLRQSLGYADYLGALQRSRDEHPHEMGLLHISRFLVEYPFADKLHPGSLEAVAHVRQWGLPVVLSDGDVVFQPIKIQKAGLCEAFSEHVLIYRHKEQELRDVERRYPAQHYVLIDDNVRILSAVKAVWKDRVTTVHVSQGHYNEPSVEQSTADVTLGHIKDLSRITQHIVSA
jgi:FMN phosphatase YigB (HAD superfamily)